MRIKGKLFSIEIENQEGVGTLIQIYSDDDGFLHEQGDSFSEHWLPELIQLLMETQIILNSQKMDKRENLNKKENIMLYVITIGANFEGIGINSEFIWQEIKNNIIYYKGVLINIDKNYKNNLLKNNIIISFTDSNLNKSKIFCKILKYNIIKENSEENKISIAIDLQINFDTNNIDGDDNK